VRWLAVKDLQVLRRSPLLLALLVAYPIVISVLIGLALSRGPEKPKVAFLNEVPAGQATVDLGGERIDTSKYAAELFKSVTPIRVKSRAEAVAKVRDGEALGALIVPADIVQRLQGSASLTGSPQPPTVEVLYNVEDPIKAAYVQSVVDSRLAEANRALSEKLTTTTAEYLKILLEGGSIDIFGRSVDILGLRTSQAIVEAAARAAPAGSASRAGLERVGDFAGEAVDNLDVSSAILRSIANPIEVKQTVVKGAKTPLSSFALAVSVTLSLMFVAVLLGAGLLALEREEHTFTRLVRGLVSRTGITVEKTALSAAFGLLVTALMTCGVGLFVDVDFGRAPQWLAGLAAGALAFAAMGVAIGALTREVRAASLLAVLLALPVAFLALVPSGAVATGLYDAIRVVSALFPFRPTLDALRAGLDGAGSLGPPLLHLLALLLAYGLLARLALRRFAR
jgi:ABC-type transport system involved in cytochrome c biogenesis permease component